ncbi:MAG: murein biosynthesis integral membrane protein MurJ [Alphaproteobacteria bacterium]|nr:murein biosynthesis integral membrane protein MurJ [Alphaproteobacteria bacterium]
MTGRPRRQPRRQPRAQPLARAFRQISGLTGVSRLLGFARDVTFATFLGAGPAADAFLVALKLPNMFRRLTAEGAMANAFVPAFTAARQEDGEPAAMTLAGEVQTTLTVTLCLVVGLAEIFMPAVVAVIAPGFADTPARMEAAIALGRVTFPYLPIISLVAFWAAIANANQRFMVAAAMPLIFNLCLIGGALVIPVASGWLAVERAMPLAAALLCAGALQLVVMAALLRRHRIMPAWCLPRFGVAARAMWRQFGIASAGAVVMQINLIIDLVLASLLTVGAISWLYFADRVAQLPLGIFGIALGTALLPRLSSQFRSGDLDAARSSLSEALLFAAFLVIPATVALVAIAPQIVGGLFRYGAFSAADAAASAAALTAYAIGMPAHIMVKILQPAFYATARPGYVLKVSIVAVITNLSLSLSLMPVLGHVGLALATSLSGMVAAGALTVRLLRDGHMGVPAPMVIARICGATMVMLAVLLLARGWIATWPAIGLLATLVAAGGAAYLAVAFMLRAVPRQLLRR